MGSAALVLFMFLIGLELPWRRLREQATRVVAIGTAVVAAAVGSGFVLAMVLGAPVSWRVASIGARVVPPTAHALMIGGALAATALPVVAAILRDRELLLTRVGAVGVGVCAIVTPLTFLVVDAAAAVAGNGLLWAVGPRLLGLGALVAALLGVVGPLLEKLSRQAVAHGRETGGGILAVLVTGALLTGAVADAGGVGALTGGLLFGMTVPRIDGLVEAVRMRLRQPVVIVGVPVFLAVTGLQTNLRVLRPEQLGAIALLLAASAVGKWGVATVVGRVVGMPVRDAAAVGTMLACGGLMTLVVVRLGREAGILTTAMQATLVSTAVISTVVTAPLMVWATARCATS
jgi:Kef-type K+ transport system membrane component KefB